MTANEVIERAVELVEEQYDNDVWYEWIDAVLRDLNPLTKLIETEEVTLTIANGEAEIDLSAISDCFEVISVSFKPTGKRAKQLRRIPPYDSYSMGWVHYDTTLKLLNLAETAGTAIVTYYALLARTSDGATDYTLNLPEKYHDIIVKGICAMSMQKEEEFDRKQDFFSEYMLGKQRLYMERILAVEPWNQGGGQQ